MNDLFKSIDANLQQNPIKVMIIDSSSVNAGLVAKLIEQSLEIKIVSAVSDIEKAHNELSKTDIEIVVLDIKNNNCDVVAGLLNRYPRLQIITLASEKDFEKSIKSLGLGAIDYIEIPEELENKDISVVHTKLVEKIKTWGATIRRYEQNINRVKHINKNTSEIVLVPESKKFKADVIVIASSTGGPQALAKIFSNLKGEKIEQPIFIIQHIPPSFTKTLADHLEKLSSKKCYEGADGMKVESECVYIAPGGRHMIVENNEKNEPIIKIIDTPAENFCKPSAEPTVRSLLSVYGGNILEIVLTGMGNDGHKSAQNIVNAGGCVIAQDQATSIVWGMPGAVAFAGLCSQILPLDRIAPYIIEKTVRR